MDTSSLSGILILILALTFAVFMSGTGFGTFVNGPALLIVIGGTFGAVMLSYRLNIFIAALKNIPLAFKGPTTNKIDTLDTLVDISDIARRKGSLALEGYKVDDPFIQKAITLMVDGHDPDTITYALGKDILLKREHNNDSIKVLNSFTELAPAMGMIGTLIGLVAMLINMNDPSSIGAAMSVALLTTLYGALIANGFTAPLSKKLSERAAEIRTQMSMVRDGFTHIAQGDNPRLIYEMLNSYIDTDKKANNEQEQAQAE